MWRILLSLLLMVPAAAAEPARDARGDVHASPTRLSVEYAAPEVDLLSFDIVADARHYRLILEVLDPAARTVPDGEPVYAVAFANDDLDAAVVLAHASGGDWSFYAWTENGSAQGSVPLEGHVRGSRVEIHVPKDLLRSDLHWFVVSSGVKGGGVTGSIDGGPAWLRDSLPDEGRGPAWPLPEDDASATSVSGDAPPMRERIRAGAPLVGGVALLVGMVAAVRRR